MVFSGGGLWDVLRPRRLLYIRLEHNGWFPRYHLHCRPSHVPHQRVQPQDLWYPAGFPSIALVAPLEGHKSSPWLETSRTNPPVITSTHRKYRTDLLYVFHYFWYLGGAALQGGVLLLHQGGCEE